MEFGHHPEPAVDFCLEVDAIEGEMTDRKAGFPATMDLAARLDRAMQFNVGGDSNAKHDLRLLEKAFKAAAADAAAPRTEDAGESSTPTPALTDERIEELAHRIAWRYKHSSDENHSHTYTFNRGSLNVFARAIERAVRGESTLPDGVLADASGVDGADRG